MKDPRADRQHPAFSVSSTTALTPRRVSWLWLLLPQRTRFRLMVWHTQREGRAFQKRAHRQWLARFPLLTRRNRRRVARILRTRWDHTGTRLLGVPSDAFDGYADQLLMCLSPTIPDKVVAQRLSDFEEELGLRDSPLAHRLQLVALIRATVT